MTATIGGFDGMHIAHQELLKKAEFMIVIEKGSNLTPGLDRCEYTTLEFVFFDLNNIKYLSPYEFIKILKSLKVSKIVIGDDFRFGKERKGDINLLKKHFKVEVIKEIKIDGIGVHSHIIRDFIRSGNIKKANIFLGHTYKIKGIQIKGQGLGSKELVPTINIELIKNYLIPKKGVYITKTNNLPSITFIGNRSTDGKFSIETHILSSEFQVPSSKLKMLRMKSNSKLQVPGSQLIKIEFLEFLRENKKFDSLSKLKKQIKEDIKVASNILKQCYTDY